MNYFDCEHLVYKKLLSRKYEVKDVTADKRYWEFDIDFIAKKNNTKKYIEVKTDSHIGRTQNVAIELYHDYNYPQVKVSEGWFGKTDCDELWYCDSENNIAYVFDMNKLFDYVQENKKKYKKSWTDDKHKRTYFLLVPLSDLSELYDEVLLA